MNTTLATIDANGTVRSRYAYEPFGRVAVTGDNPFQHTGCENDGTDQDSACTYSLCRLGC